MGLYRSHERSLLRKREEFIELSGIGIPPSTPWAFHLLVLTHISNSTKISCGMWVEPFRDLLLCIVLLSYIVIVVEESGERCTLSCRYVYLLDGSA